jgi:hypothetical protein
MSKRWPRDRADHVTLTARSSRAPREGTYVDALDILVRTLNEYDAAFARI